MQRKKEKQKMKNKIKLTDTELQKIIKESIQAILEKKTSEYVFDINSIDISKIDIDILKNAYIDFRLIPFATSFDDPLSFPLFKEAKGDILPPDSVVNTIKQKYQLDSRLIVKMEMHNQIYIYVIVACIGKNDTLIEEDMKKLGYYLGRRGEIQKVKNMFYQILQFEPYSQLQNDETKNIKNKYKYLYHWTPEYNVNKILQSGLTPYNKNKKFTYPQRIYLMKGDSDLHKIMELGQLLCSTNTDINNNGVYCLLRINLNNIDNNIRFYFDPYSEIGIYTEQNIPQKFIELTSNYTFKTN